MNWSRQYGVGVATSSIPPQIIFVCSHLYVLLKDNDVHRVEVELHGVILQNRQASIFSGVNRRNKGLMFQS